MTNLTIVQMRFYHYKELLKLFALNRTSDKFAGSRNSMYCFLVVPSMTALAFNIFSPFSIFKRILIISAFGGSMTSFVFSLKDELGFLGRKDQSVLG